MPGRKQGWGFVITDPADKADWLWMRERTSVDTTGAMPPPAIVSAKPRDE
jgi:hypothetical protein